MVGDEAFEGSLEDGADGVAVQSGCFGQFLAVIVGNAAHEVNTLKVCV